jgi:hypothetical protein
MEINRIKHPIWGTWEGKIWIKYWNRWWALKKTKEAGEETRPGLSMSDVVPTGVFRDRNLSCQCAIKGSSRYTTRLGWPKVMHSNSYVDCRYWLLEDFMQRDVEITAATINDWPKRVYLPDISQTLDWKYRWLRSPYTPVRRVTPDTVYLHGHFARLFLRPLGTCCQVLDYDENSGSVCVCVGGWLSPKSGEMFWTLISNFVQEYCSSTCMMYETLLSLPFAPSYLRKRVEE